MPKLEIVQPAQVFSSEPPDFAAPFWRFLAEGDSWFTIGTLNLLANSNLLFELELQRSAIAVNCATPGDTLKRMSQINTDRNFVDLLCGKRARPWDALLMSCGGNDLIEAVDSPPIDGEGRPVPPELRLLLTQPEWGPAEMGAQRYLSEAGWQTFSNYLRANFEHLLALRDRGPSKGAPVFIHGYAFPTPRPAGAGLGAGPWLLPALMRYGLPSDDGIVVARELLTRLGSLLGSMAADAARFANLHFFDSTAVPIEPALPDTNGVSGDWVNEIHLTRAGCRKIAAAWAGHIEGVMLGEEAATAGGAAHAPLPA